MIGLVLFAVHPIDSNARLAAPMGPLTLSHLLGASGVFLHHSQSCISVGIPCMPVNEAHTKPFGTQK